MRGLESKCEGWRLRARVGDYVRRLETTCEGWRVSARVGELVRGMHALNTLILLAV